MGTDEKYPMFGQLPDLSNISLMKVSSSKTSIIGTHINTQPNQLTSLQLASQIKIEYTLPLKIILLERIHFILNDDAKIACS